MAVVGPVRAVIPIIFKGDERAGYGALFERRQSLVAHWMDDTRAAAFVSRPTGRGRDGLPDIAPAGAVAAG